MNTPMEPISQTPVPGTSLLVIVRHGQSDYNLKNLFTGWIDCPLSPFGRQEASQVGQILASRNLHFDQVFCSSLERSWETFELIREVAPGMYSGVPILRREALNERNYGELQGRNKEEAARIYGDQQVHTWRRGYDAVPPGGESLRDTELRVVHFFEEELKPMLLQGMKVLVVAHGNSLRALMMHLEHLNKEEIEKVQIATGEAISYRLGPDLNLLEKEKLQ